MTYPGDPKLSDEIRRRVEETFAQSQQLASEGKQQEATLGCEFVLRLDPLFEPARRLIDQLAGGETPNGEGAATEAPASEPAEMPMPDFSAPAGEAGDGDASDSGAPDIWRADTGPTEGEPSEAAPTESEQTGGASPLENFDLEAEIDDLLDRRDFRTLMSLAEDHQAAVQANPDLVAKVTQAAERLEAEPYMREFLDNAERAQREGRAEEAAQLIAKARELDPSHPALPPEAPSSQFNESNDRIRELLEEGQASIDRKDYQGAIDSWSRIFLIDIDHPEANKRIEKARRMKAESERQIEEAFHEAVSLWELGTTDKARELFEKVLELDSGHAGAKEYLDRMDARQVGEILDAPDPEPGPAAGSIEGLDLGASDAEIMMPPDPGAPAPGAAGSVTGAGFDDFELDAGVGEAEAPAKQPAARRGGLLQKKFLTIAGAGLALLLVLLAVAYWKRDALLPNSDEAVGSARPDILARAQKLHDQGQTSMAIGQLSRLSTDHPQYAEAQSLIAQWEAPDEEVADEPQGPSPAQIAVRDSRVASALAARDAQEYLLAAELLDEAAESAPLEAEEELILEEVRQRLAPLDSQIEMYRQGDWEFVLPELWRLHADAPEDRDIIRLMVNSYYNLGIRDLQRGDVVAADEKLERAGELDPEDAGVERLARFCDTYADRPADLLYRIFVKYLPFR